MPNSGDVDAALIDCLQTDAALRALVPDGVFYALAPPNAKRFVVVTLRDSQDVDTFDGRAVEDNSYLVAVIGLSTVMTDTDASAAAHRVDQLLMDRTLTVTGYAGATVARTSRVKDKQPTTADASMFWFHYGGIYRVHASVADSSATAKGTNDGD